jgi:predicted phage terminase large subunit-like protein
MINVPPGHGKSLMVCMWIAWTIANYPDSRFLYISYSKDLATAHTSTIRDIVSLAHYRYLFDIHVKHDSKAKDAWKTTSGAEVSAFGAAGAITGRDAGLPGLDRFSGGVVCDDMHKPTEVHSDTIRESVIQNYKQTIKQRPRGVNVPIVFIGQRLHEGDLPAYLLSGDDGYDWHKVILKSIDDSGNALYPEAFPISMLRNSQKTDIYTFASQHQQDPQPAGGSLFKADWFVMLDFEPNIIQTFITADTAETDKSYNDATVFSFWGIYEINTMGRLTGEYGIHWLDCAELRIEPKDLKDSFLDFWQDCSRHKIAPLLAAIEKKSTGVTLISTLQELRGIQIRNIERNRSSGSKTTRFLEIQQYVASKRISFTKGSRHAENCINHMSKITANDSHRHDDIADTLADAIKISLIDKSIRIDTKQNELLSASIMRPQLDRLQIETDLFYGGKY